MGQWFPHQELAKLLQEGLPRTGPKKTGLRREPFSSFFAHDGLNAGASSTLPSNEANGAY